MENQKSFSLEDGLLAAGVGAMTGIRNASSLRFVTKAPIIHTLAFTEAVMDKLPFVPARTQPFPLLLRASVGGLAASSIGKQRRERWMAGVIGAVSSIAASYLFFRVRKLGTDRGRLAGFAAGLGEDALVRKIGRTIEDRIAA